MLDLRGNGGGNHTYGTRWIEGLYGFGPPMPEQPDLSRCLSSTETFVDQLRSMDNVVQAGIPTNASTKYGSNIRVESPPSQLFYYNFATVVSFDMHHASGEPLVPQVPLKYDPARDLQGGDSLLEQLERVIELQ